MPGIGDFLTGTGSTLNQIAQAMGPQGQGGQPQGGQAGPGGGGAGGAQMNPQGPMLAPPQATQSPPDLAQLYVRLAQQTQAASGIDRSLSNIGLALASPSTRAAMAGNSQTPAQDPGQMLRSLMEIQQFQYQQRQQQIMMQAAPGLARQMFGDKFTPENLQTAQGIIASGGFGEMEKNLVGGADLNQRQYLQEQRAAQQAGQPFPDFATWTAQHATAATVATEAAKSKQDAVETFPSLDPQYKTAEDTVEWLQAHPDATIKAVQWGAAANGRVGQALGGFGVLDQDTKDARAKIDQLNDENFRAGLANVKNVRSQSEANKVGGAVSSLDKPANSPQMITGELNRLTQVIQGARGNLMGAAGRTIPYKYNGLVDPTYLNPSSSIYNGSKMETPVDLSTMSEADADAAVAALPTGRAFIGPDRQPHIKN
jgi:hypothetical protein